MKDDIYTEEEKRALRALESWKDEWSTHGGILKFVDEVYSDFPEVFSPFQRVYLVKSGQSKENWRNFELEVEKLLTKKEIRIVNRVIRGNQVAIECEVELNRIDGKVIKTWFAVFLTVDNDGRIICDHTYAEGPPFKEWVEKGTLDIMPDFKNATQKILDSQ
jgi:hypothetical protein